MSEIMYTDNQATDEALLLFLRKIHRLYPAAYADVITKLPDGAREALSTAELRADTLRSRDRESATTRTYPTAYEID